MQRILVIDDDVEVRELIRAVLESADYEVEVRGDGIEGEKVLQNRNVDLIVTDMFMPEKDGLQLIRELRRLQPRPRIVAMSAGLTSVDYDPLPAASLMGAVGVLNKPFSVTTLLETVKRALEPANT